MGTENTFSCSDILPTQSCILEASCPTFCKLNESPFSSYLLRIHIILLHWEESCEFCIFREFSGPFALFPDVPKPCKFPLPPDAFKASSPFQERMFQLDRNSSTVALFLFSIPSWRKTGDTPNRNKVASGSDDCFCSAGEARPSCP